MDHSLRNCTNKMYLPRTVQNWTDYINKSLSEGSIIVYVQRRYNVNIIMNAMNADHWTVCTRECDKTCTHLQTRAHYGWKTRLSTIHYNVLRRERTKTLQYTMITKRKGGKKKGLYTKGEHATPTSGPVKARMYVRKKE